MPHLHVLLEGGGEEGQGGEFKESKIPIFTRLYSLSDIIVLNWNFPNFS